MNILTISKLLDYFLHKFAHRSEFHTDFEINKIYDFLIFEQLESVKA